MSESYGAIVYPQWISPDGLRLYITVSEDGHAYRAMMVSRASASQPFGVPTPVPGVSLATTSVLAITLSQDELRAVVSTQILDAIDLYVMKRTSREGVFGDVERLAVSTDKTDDKPFLRADE